MADTSDRQPNGDRIEAKIDSRNGVIAVGKNIVQDVRNYYFAPTMPQQFDQATLDAANARLAKMPLDSVPGVNPLPAGSRMVLSDNPVFVGRQEQLKALARNLKGGQSVAVSQVSAATGMGGIGKTQLATAFVHRYGAYFQGGVFWLDFGNSNAIPAEIAACGREDALALHSGLDKMELPEQVRHVLAAWQSPLPRLLIFDNCEDPDLLAAWRPPTGGCCILVTSRHGDWNPTYGVQQLRLDVLPRAESIALLREFSIELPENDPELNGIAKELGDLPLALHLAGSYLYEYRYDVTPGEYLSELRGPDLLDLEAFVLEEGHLPTAHDLNVGRTFRLSLDRLDRDNEVDAVGLALLARAAHFSPGTPIPRDLLFATLDLEGKDSSRRKGRGIRRLVALGLIEEEADGQLRLHRLLVHFVLSEIDNEAAQEDVECTLLAEAGLLNRTGDPRPLLTWQVHLRHLVDVMSPRKDEQAGFACNRLGYHLQEVGDLAGSRPYLERSLAIRQEMLGEKHPDTARSFNNMGSLLHDMGNLSGARSYYERALAIRQEILGEQHPDTAGSLNDLGLLLQDLGDLAGARPYHERALAIYEETLGEEHPDTAYSLLHLGLLYHEQGDLDVAKPYYERALVINERVFGDQHPRTALSLNNLGLLLRDQGNLATARPYMERSVASWDGVIGDKHPEMARSLGNLGLLLRGQGNLSDAKTYLERALAIRMDVLGAQHPDTVNSLNTLGSLLLDLRDLTTARRLLESAVTISENVLEEQHRWTSFSLNNLGSLLRVQGDLSGARHCLERALAMRLELFGEQHPETARSLDNLGLVMRDQGDFGLARHHLERALAIKTKVLGEQHPDTATSLNNLGTLLQAQGDLSSVRPYYTQALAIHRELLGEEHPDTAQSLNNLGSLLQAQGDLSGAKPYYEQALAIFEVALGPEHPYTQAVRRNLKAVLDQLEND